MTDELKKAEENVRHWREQLNLALAHLALIQKRENAKLDEFLGVFGGEPGTEAMIEKREEDDADSRK